jgi:DNA-binding PadR family transcriptional regulator
MSLESAVLAVLADGPKHGYAVHGAVRALLAGLRAVNHGQVYATLERLRRDRLVLRDARTPGRSGFALAAAGRHRLERRLERSAAPVAPAGDLAARLVLLAAAGDREGVARIVAEQRVRCAALERVLAARPRDLVREAALRHVAAEREWLALVERTLLPPARPLCD